MRNDILKRVLNYFGLTLLANIAVLIWINIFTLIPFIKLLEYQFEFFQSSLATILSIVAIIIALDEIMQTRIHNRLSVRPRLSLGFNGRTDTDISVELKNTGIGPAVVLKMDLYVDDKLQPSSTAFNFFHVLEFVNIQDPHAIEHIDLKEVISIGDSLDLITVKRNMDEEFHHLNLIKLARIRILINYESFYGEQFQLNEYFFPDVKIPTEHIAKYEADLNLKKSKK